MAISCSLAWVYPNPSVLECRNRHFLSSLIDTQAPASASSITIVGAGPVQINRRLGCSTVLRQLDSPVKHNRRFRCSRVLLQLGGQTGREDIMQEELINVIEEELSSYEDAGKMGNQALLKALTLADLTERLGIHRYFEHQIDKILHSVFMSWNEKEGLKDAHITVLAFRLLRLRGYSVSADILAAIKGRGGNGFAASYSTTSSTNTSAMLNLYRCSQLSFPSESNIMGEAKEFAKLQLNAAVSDESSTLLQTDNLKSEVQFAMEFPRRCILPRLESRFLVRHLWPGNASTRKYLELAKLELNIMQKQYQQELEELETWWEQQGFRQVDYGGITIKKLLFAGAPTMFEPQFSANRLGFAKMCSLVSIFDFLTDNKKYNIDHIRRLTDALKRWDPSLLDDIPLHKLLLESICVTMEEMAIEAGKVQDRDLLPQFKALWFNYADSNVIESEWIQSGYVPTFEEYMKVAYDSFASEILTWTAIFVMGERVTAETCSKIGIGTRFTYLVGVVGRLVNDLVGIEKGFQDGKFATAINCYQRDNPRLSREEVIVSIEGLIKSSCQELELELSLSRATVPEFFTLQVLNLARTACLVYKTGDAHNTNIKEYAKLVEEFFFGSLEII